MRSRTPLAAAALALAFALSPLPHSVHAAVVPPRVEPAPRAPLPQPRKIEVTLTGGLTMETLLREGLDIVGAEGDRVMLLEWPGDAAKLARIGARVSLLDANPGMSQALTARQELAISPPPPTLSRRVGSESVTQAPPYGGGSMGGYWTIAEIKAKLDDLVALDGNDVVADKIDTVGYSLEGRPIWGLEIGKHVTGPDTRPVAFYNSLTHAREPGGMLSLFYFVDDLLSKYGTDPFATYLLDQRRIYICPLVNPDGFNVNEQAYIQTSGFAMWRKNTADNNHNGTFASDSDGVDLNRNYSYKWNFDGLGSSGDVTTETYRGPAAFSEPETRAQRDLITLLQPKTALSFHTWQDLMLHPWGYSATDPLPEEDAFHEWDDLLNRELGYGTGRSGPLLYLVNGEFNDWCYGDVATKPKLYSWTPEVGSSVDFFWPPPSRIVPLAQSMLRPGYVCAAIAGAFVQHESWTITEGALAKGMPAHISVRARNQGSSAQAGPGLTGTLTPLTGGVVMTVSAISYPDLAVRTSGDPLAGATFTMTVDDTITPGRLLPFKLEFTDASGLFSRDTIFVPLGAPTVLAADDASSGMSQWTATPGTAWNIVTGDPNHLSRYFADSPAGNYGLGITTMTLNTPLNLSTGGIHAYVFYETRYDTEKDVDCAVVEASFNGTTWTNLRASGSVRGNTVVGGPQQTSPWCYGGTRWRWRAEWADLSSFTGPTSTAVRLRFRMKADGSTFFDGVSLDSVRVVFFDAPDTTTATLLSRFDGNWTGDGVELHWQFLAGAGYSSVAMERSESATGPWRSIAGEPRDDDGTLVLVDRDAEAGRTYFYRLVATTLAGQVQTFGPLAVTASAIGGFELAALQPSPSRGQTAVQFSVPRESRVRLTVLDVQGRLVATLADGVYRAGRHQATFDAAGADGRVRAGILFVRLDTAEFHSVRKLIVLP